MMLVSVQQWPPVVILCVNSTVCNSRPTKRQQEARLQAPASGRGTGKEACKSVGRKGMVIRNDKQQKDGARKLKRVPVGEVSVGLRARSSSAADMQRGSVLLVAPATEESSSLLWVNTTGSSSAYLPKETLPAFDSGRCLPSERSPVSCVEFGQHPLSVNEKFQP